MGYFGYICPVCSFCIQGNSHLRGSYNTKEEVKKARNDVEDDMLDAWNVEPKESEKEDQHVFDE